MTYPCIYVSTWPGLHEVFPRLIQAKTGSVWTHAGFQIDEDHTFCALTDGVHVRPNDPDEIKLMLEVPFCEGALAKARTRDGDKYDFLNIAAIIFGTDWHWDHRDICDKLVFWAFQQDGHPLLNHTFLQLEKLTPRDILLSPAITGHRIIGTIR